MDLKHNKLNIEKYLKRIKLLELGPMMVTLIKCIGSDNSTEKRSRQRRVVREAK